MPMPLSDSMVPLSGSMVPKWTCKGLQPVPGETGDTSDFSQPPIHPLFKDIMIHFHTSCARKCRGKMFGVNVKMCSIQP